MYKDAALTFLEMSPLHLFLYFSIQNNNNNTYIHTVQGRVSAMHYYMYFICIVYAALTLI